MSISSLPPGVPTYLHPAYPLPDADEAPYGEAELVDWVTLGMRHHLSMPIDQHSPDDYDEILDDLCDIVVNALRVERPSSWQYDDFSWLLIRFAAMVQPYLGEHLRLDIRAWALHTVFAGGVQPHKCLMHPDRTIRLTAIRYAAILRPRYYGAASARPRVATAVRVAPC